MAHQDTPEAVDVPVTDVDSAAAALTASFESEDVEEEQPAEGAEEEFAEGDLDEPETDADEPEGEETDEDDEPETVIEAPASLNAEAKAAFANAPPEVQEVWAATEKQRNTQVQEATTRAADREKNAQALAMHEARAEAANRQKEWLEQFKPQPPSAELARTDPNRYNALIAQYDAESRWYSEQETSLTAEINEQETAAQQEFLQQRSAELSKLPEVADEATRAQFFDKVEAIAGELGIPKEHVFENAEANDIRILSQVSDWKKDSDELAKIRANGKIKRDSAGKFRSQKPGSAQPKRSGNKAYTQAKGRLAKTGSVEDAAAIFEQAFAKG